MRHFFLIPLLFLLSNPALAWWGKCGSQYEAEAACEKYGADDAFPIDDIDEILPGMMEGRHRIYYEMGKNTGLDNQIMSWVNKIRSQVKKGAQPPGEFIDLRHALHATHGANR